MYKNKIKNKFLLFIATFLPLTVFTKEIGMFEYKGIQFDIISYTFYMFIFVTILISKKIKFTKIELIIFGYIIFVGTLNIIKFHLPFILFLKQLIPIFIYYSVTKYIIFKVGASYVFEKYINYTVVVAWIGIVQILLKLVGINFLTPLGGIYIDSVALEPSHYVLIVLPAVVYLYEKKIFSWKFYLILLTLFLTFKLTAYVSIVLYFIIRNYKHFGKLILLGSISLVALTYLIINNPEFLSRITSFIDFANSGDAALTDNLTTFSLASNLQVAIHNFIQTYGMGIGLGGHETMYERSFSGSLLHESWTGINAKSAHSLTIRIISELGLLGILTFIVFIRKLANIKIIELQAIGWGAFSHFIGKTIKLGGYFDYGTIFFLVLVIYAIKANKYKGNYL